MIVRFVRLRLDVLKKINNSVKVVPTIVEFVDIAGIVKGASEGTCISTTVIASKLAS